MNAIVQTILNISKLEATLIKISDATEDSFVMSIESRVTGTGPIPSVMAPMEVDLVFGGKSFGKLGLPEVRPSMSGTTVVVNNQFTKILDADAFRAFVKAITLDDDLVLTLDNGECTIKALGMTSHCKYKKSMHIKGMRGPQLTMVETTSEYNVMRVSNPSPLEIDHGFSRFELVIEGGEVVAELEGPLEIVRGGFDSKMNVKFRKGSNASKNTNARLVGKGTDGKAWTDETLKYINSPVTLTSQFCSLLS